MPGLRERRSIDPRIIAMESNITALHQQMKANTDICEKALSISCQTRDEVALMKPTVKEVRDILVGAASFFKLIDKTAKVMKPLVIILASTIAFVIMISQFVNDKAHAIWQNILK